jgi:hypothetical protein
MQFSIGQTLRGTSSWPPLVATGLLLATQIDNDFVGLAGERKRRER